MIDWEKAPRNGQLLIIAYFKQYKSYIQNESRRLLKRSIPSLGKEIGLVLSPLLFGILRHVENKVSRPVGVFYSFGYHDTSEEKLREFFEKLQVDYEGRKQVQNMWMKYDMMVAAKVRDEEI